MPSSVETEKKTVRRGGANNKWDRVRKKAEREEKKYKRIAARRQEVIGKFGIRKRERIAEEQTNATKKNIQEAKHKEWKKRIK